jgi:hypothetical protein
LNSLPFVISTEVEKRKNYGALDFMNTDCRKSKSAILCPIEAKNTGNAPH